MLSFAIRRSLRFGVAAAMALSVVGLRTASEADTKAERFTATAVQLEAPMGSVTTPVDILIERWSTDAERDALMNNILEGSPEALLKTVQKFSRVGSIRGNSSLGYDLRYARRVAGPDGGERITIVTDRPIGFWETRSMSRTVDYPFTVIDLRILGNGKGEGKMTVGTKITADKEDRTIVLEDYNVQPVLLTNVRREK
jgi:hypothetical protein